MTERSRPRLPGGHPLDQNAGETTLAGPQGFEVEAELENRNGVVADGALGITAKVARIDFGAKDSEERRCIHGTILGDAGRFCISDESEYRHWHIRHRHIGDSRSPRLGNSLSRHSGYRSKATTVPSKTLAAQGLPPPQGDNAGWRINSIAFP